ncbi:transcription factor Adf-1-like isoform X1 [Corticium candelabrum]|uniref:transcription factor Adf-1-like isoform X1 n=1 Tax=Corticium candelabrum TaxID=121492 RepID=UPI002E256533|nr:transcription factor Adf-1-like isoform X1 [Corticium candelabrum]
MATNMLDVERLIESVRSCPCLWKVNCQVYKDLRARENAWKWIASELGVSAELCQKKWKSLRDKYVREVKLLQKKRLSGTGGPPATSSWVFFTVMTFLDISVKHRTTDSNFSLLESQQESQQQESQQQESQQQENQPGESQPAESEPYDSDETVDNHESNEAHNSSVICQVETGPRQLSITPATKRKRRRKGPEDELETSIVERLNSLDSKRAHVDSDEDGLFGRQIAATLRRFPYEKKAFAKLRLQQVMLEVELGGSGDGFSLFRESTP